MNQSNEMVMGAFRSKRILIIEIDQDLRDLIAEELRRLGATVHESSNARDGFNLALKHSPDLVITEVDTPYQSGLDLLQGIRTNFPLVPVILTDGARRITEADAYVAGAQAVFRKPFELRSLFRTMARFVSDAHTEALRRFPRYEVNFPAEIIVESDSNPFCTGRVLNISKLGAFVQFWGVLPVPGQLISFRIRAGTDQELVIEGSAAVRWTRDKSEFGDKPAGCGLEFADVEGRFEQQILQILRKVGGCS